MNNLYNDAKNQNNTVLVIKEYNESIINRFQNISQNYHGYRTKIDEHDFSLELQPANTSPFLYRTWMYTYNLALGQISSQILYKFEPEIYLDTGNNYLWSYGWCIKKQVSDIEDMLSSTNSWLSVTVHIYFRSELSPSALSYIDILDKELNGKIIIYYNNKSISCNNLNLPLIPIVSIFN